MTDTTAAPDARPDGHPDAQAETPDGNVEEGRRLTESVLDNLPAWAFIALAIAALYMVWATLVIIDKYVGDSLPTFLP